MISVKELKEAQLAKEVNRILSKIEEAALKTDYSARSIEETFLPSSWIPCREKVVEVLNDKGFTVEREYQGHGFMTVQISWEV